MTNMTNTDRVEIKDDALHVFLADQEIVIRRGRVRVLRAQDGRRLALRVGRV
jgi:hypothetical protein